MFVYLELQLSLYNDCIDSVFPIWKDEPKYSKCGTDERARGAGGIEFAIHYELDDPDKVYVANIGEGGLVYYWDQHMMFGPSSCEAFLN